MPEGTNQYFGKISREYLGQGVRCLVLAYAPNELQPWHTHERPSLFFVLTGGHFDDYRTNHDWQPFDAGLYRPEDARHRAQTGPNGVVGLALEFVKPSPLTEKAWYGLLQLPATSVLPHMIADGLLNPHLDLADVDSQVQDLLAVCHSDPKLASKHCPDWLDVAIQHIRSHLAETLNLADIAQVCGVHPVHLSRTFSHQLGVSLSEYVRLARLRLALNLVAEHGWTVGNAAHEAGFCDHAHFCRVWRRQFKTRPEFWRSQNCRKATLG